MSEFFKSIKFKILLGIVIVFGAFLLRALWTGGFSPMLAQLVGAVTTPFQKGAAYITEQVDGFFDNFADARALEAENEALRLKIAELNEQLVEFETYRQENQQLRQAVGLQEEHPDFELINASVIGRDYNDRFGSFTIDKGSYHGVQPRDPVVSAEGLVGIVSEVGLTQCTVATIMDVAVKVGAVDNRTRETGIVSGRVELAEQGLCRFSYLDRESGISAGDLVITSGSDTEGMFPKGLVIGTIVEVAPETSGLSLYATIRPAADASTVRDVFVITDFLGQGEAAIHSGESQAEIPEVSGQD